MSHFTVVVIVPPSYRRDELKGRVDELIAPYYEGLEVPEYEDVCYCVGQAARRKASERALAEMGFKSFDEMRDEFRRRHPKLHAKLKAKVDEASRCSTKEETKRVWKEYGAIRTKLDKLWEKECLARYEALEAAFFEMDPLKDKPDPKCEECKGTGIVRLTYNPFSKWDWYRVGGRWDGEMLGLDIESEDGGFNFSPEHESLENNSCRVKDIHKDFIPFAVVTPDGLWHEKGEMGWWAVVTNEKSDSKWKREVKSIFKKYPDHWAVLLDCHI